MTTVSNKFNVKFEVIQTDKHDQGLQGSFEVLGKGNSDLKSELYVLSQTGLKGSFEAVIASEIQGSFVIPPRNKFKVKFDVAPPPKVTKRLYAVKDVFVYEGNKTYNYGLWSYLQVGVSPEGLVSRSFLDFDFSDFPTNTYITKATLVLFSKSRTAFEGLELSTADREYIETNVVWGNQPLRERFISVSNIEDRQYMCTFDVTDVVKNVWYGQNHENHGFLLKSYDESVPQQIQFFSKESINYVPYLEIEYFEPDLYQFGAGAIQGDFDVIVPTRDDGIHGSFEVYKEKDTSSLSATFYLINNDMINADFYVAEQSDLKGSLNVWRSSEISGDFTVHELPESYPELQADFWIVRYDPNFNMYYEFMRGAFEVADSSWIHGSLYVANKSELGGSLFVAEQSDLEGSFEIVHLVDFGGIIENILPLEKSQLSGSLEVVHFNEIHGVIDNILPLERIELQGSFNVVRLQGEATLFGQFYVAQNIELSSDFYVAHEKDLKSEFEVKHANDLSGSLIVIADPKIRGEFEVVIPDDTQIRGDFQAIAQTTLNGEFDIKQDRIKGEFTVLAKNDLSGSLFVPEKKDLKGGFVVWKSVQIYGALEVIPLGFTDLGGSFYLNGRIPVDKSYAFIM